MNDISVKIEESLKDQPVVEAPAAEHISENDVDPLAIDEGEVESVKGPLSEAPAEQKQKVEEVEKVESCDENAKEVILEENDAQETLTQNADKIEDELLKDDDTTVEETVPVVTEKAEVVGTEPVIEQKPEVIEEASNPIEEPKSLEEPPKAEEIKTVEALVTEKAEVVDTEPVIEQKPEVIEEASNPIEEASKSPEEPPKAEEIKTVEALPESVLEIPKSVTPKPLSPPQLPKEPSPPKEISVLEPKEKYPKESAPPEKESTDIEMIEVSAQIPKPTANAGKEKEAKATPPPVNGDVQSKEDQSSKRRASEDIETESPLKRLCQEVEKTFPQHDTMINDYIQTATKNNVDEIQRHTEQLLSEIQTLRELAQKKEHEWNNILHLKKVKEEILLRLLRRKQVLSFEKSAEVNGAERSDPFEYLNQAKNLAIDKSDEISGLSLKQPGSTMNPMMQAPVMPVNSHFNPMAGLPPPYDKAHMQPMPKPVYPQAMMMPGPMPGMPGFPRDINGLPGNFGMPVGRQGPTKDVKSIIADYRQRNPDITPRRGRRMKSILNPNMMNPPRPIAPKMDSMSSLNNMLFNNLDMNQKAMLERLQQIQAGGLLNGVSFKDVLVQYANMQQGPGMMPRPLDMNRPEHHIRPEGRRRQERNHEEPHTSSSKQAERIATSSPRLPPPPPYPEISLLPVTTSQETTTSQQQNSLLHGILTKQASPASQSYSPTLAKLLTSPERKQTPTLPTFGQAKNCGEITITPVQPTPPPEPQPEKTEEVVQLDDEESAASSPSGAGSPSGSGSGRLVIDEGGEAAGGGAAAGDEAEEDAPLCQGCRRRDAQFVCAGCANQWYCSRDCQVAAWDEHSEMCSG